MILAALLVALAAYARAGEVTALTSADFDSFIAANEFVLVEFFAPWCGHCKKLEPEYKAAAKEIADNIKLATVDATIESDLASRFGVRGYPTLKWFRSGSPTEYNGPRDAKGIAAWVTKKSGPVTVTIEESGVADFVAGKLAVVGRFKAANNAAHTAFVEAAKDGDLEAFAFGEIIGAKADSVTLHAAHLGEPLKHDGVAVLKDFILNNGYPLVDELPEAWNRYQAKGLPLAILFVDPAAENAAVLKEATDAAAAVKGKFSISYADGVRFKSQIERMGGQTETLPSLAAMKLSGKANYPYTGALESAAIAAWANGIVDGAIKATLKSEEIPSEQGNVHVVVGKSFQSYLDSGKDLFLEIYAPWCGHCKSLAPIYEQLGDKYASNENIVIGKLDGTANDLEEVDIRGFPTLFFFPAGKGLAGKMDYEGGRTLEDMVKFIDANSAFAGKTAESKSEL